MSLLISGLILFWCIHLLPSFPTYRQQWLNRLGEKGYKLIYALISLGAIVMVVKGKSAAEFTALWQPLEQAKFLTIPMMLLAVTLFIASTVPTNIKRFTAHPLCWSAMIWSIAHLLSNGDLASVVLFVGFGLYGLAALISANRRGATCLSEEVPLKNDIILGVVSLVIYSAIGHFHEQLFGVAVI